MKKLILFVVGIAASTLIFAQIKQSKTTPSKTDSTQQAAYACPMHPDVTGAKSDKCSKCGMALTPAKYYACPMHPEVNGNKKAKCSKCGMDLVEVKVGKPKKS